MSHTNDGQSSKDDEEMSEEQKQQEEGEEEDIIYLDEEEIEAMDQDEEDEGDDFQTVNESDIGDANQYEEGQILAQEIVQDDSVTKFTDHKDSVFCVNYVPREPYNTFISGDCNDKALLWRIIKEEDKTTEENQPEATEEEKKQNIKVKTVPYKHLPGHTETVEFAKFNHDGKLLVTGGLNNKLKIWNVDNDFELKKTVEDGPTDDLNFLEWHPKGNVLITGGKDYLIWMINGQNGQFINCLQGHQGEVLAAQFTINDTGKHILSSSSDNTIRLWSPIKNSCIQVIKDTKGLKFHEAEIGCFAQHHERPLIVSGDMQGKVFYSHYQTGEIGGIIGDHTDSVESICFNKQLPICVSAGIDTYINIYDLNQNQMRSKIQPSEYGGYTKIKFSEIQPHVLFAASTLGDFTLIDVRNGKTVKTFKGHSAAINDFVEVKPLEIVVTAGDDRRCLVFDIRGLQ